jgi:hypothetical protein
VEEAEQADLIVPLQELMVLAEAVVAEVIVLSAMEVMAGLE